MTFRRRFLRHVVSSRVRSCLFLAPGAVVFYAAVQASEPAAPPPPNPDVAALEVIRQLPPAPLEAPPPTATPGDIRATITTALGPNALRSAPKIADAAEIVAPGVVAPGAFSSEPLRDIVRRRKLMLPLPNAQIIVTKSQRRLDVMSGSTLVKSYRVALGENPTGHKQSQGDHRTPEGRFYICTRNARNSQFHIFLGLSYPSLPDATRAMQGHQITSREYQLIRQRLASRGAPLWHTRLGGWVGIHGGTNGAFAQKKIRERGKPDWTAGCIALTDREIAEIAAATQLGTPVMVRP